MARTLSREEAIKSAENAAPADNPSPRWEPTDEDYRAIAAVIRPCFACDGPCQFDPCGCAEHAARAAVAEYERRRKAALLAEPSDRMVEAACDALVDYIDSITMLHDAEEADMMRAAIRATMQAAGE